MTLDKGYFEKVSFVNAMSLINEAEFPVIEVPLELRGWSDEEIIRHSESRGRRTYRNRPSKRERLRRKLELENAKMRKIAQEYAEKSVKNLDGSSSVAASSPMPASARPTVVRVLKPAFCG